MPSAADDLLRDRARRLSQPAGELERERDGEIAEGPARCRFDRHTGQHGIVRGQPIEAADRLGHLAADQCVDWQNHESALILRTLLQS